MNYWHSCKEKRCFRPVVTTSKAKITCHRCTQTPIVTPDLFTKKIDPSLFTDVGGWNHATLKGAVLNGHWISFDANGEVISDGVDGVEVTSMNFTLNDE